jgi:maleamate amidohydrolase
VTSHPAVEAFGATVPPGTRPVVLAVDLMRAYFDPASPLCLPDDACLHSAARVLQVAREHDVPVVHTRVSYGPGGLDGGVFFRKVPALAQLVGDSPMGELMGPVAPREDELVVVKQYASAFFGTSLASTLHARGVDTVVVVGVSTSGCIRATVVDAIQHGFVPLVVEDAVGDRAPEPHHANLHDLRTKYAEVVDEAAAIAYLEALP